MKASKMQNAQWLASRRPRPHEMVQEYPHRRSRHDFLVKTAGRTDIRVTGMKHYVCVTRTCCSSAAGASFGESLFCVYGNAAQRLVKGNPREQTHRRILFSGCDLGCRCLSGFLILHKRVCLSRLLMRMVFSSIGCLPAKWREQIKQLSRCQLLSQYIKTRRSVCVPLAQKLPQNRSVRRRIRKRLL